MGHTKPHPQLVYAIYAIYPIYARLCPSMPYIPMLSMPYNAAEVLYADTDRRLMVDR